MLRAILCTIQLVLFTLTLSMAQSITLNDLLTLQSSKDPSVVANYFNNNSEWITDHSVFTDSKEDYDWYKAAVGEEFEPNTKDRLLYSVYGSYDPGIVYITLERTSFDALYSEFGSSGMALIDSKTVAGLNYYAYANADQVIEIYEPLTAHNGHLNHTFMVYTKSDYTKGFRIK